MSEKWEVGLEAFCAAGFVFVSISQIVTVSVEEEEEEEEGGSTKLEVTKGRTRET